MLKKNKDGDIKVFKHYKNESTRHKNKGLRSNIGSEYELPFIEFCLENGIIHVTMDNQALNEMTYALLNSLRLPNNLWKEFVFLVNHILNKVLHKKSNRTPCELWKGR